MNKAMPRVLIVVGALSLVAAGVILIYTRLDDYLAGMRAESLLQQILNNGWKPMELSELSEQDPIYSSTMRTAIALENPDEEPEPADPDAPIEFSVLGVLEIPKLKKRLPVLDRSIYPLLNISVCRYTGRVEEKPIRLVIAGHNIRSHFGEISTLEVGDEVLFKTQEGATFRYRMIYSEECHMNNGEAVVAGYEWDLTLLTCKKERTMRYLVRFKEVLE